MATYRSIQRERVTTREGRKAIYEKLIHLLHHLDGFNLQLLALRVNLDEIEVDVSGDIAPRQAAHLNLEKVA